MVTKETIEQLRKMINEAHAMMGAAAQFAGENNIPLKYIDPDYEEDDEERDPDDEDGPKLWFGGQGFDLRKSYKGDIFYWHNSNC